MTTTATEVLYAPRKAATVKCPNPDCPRAFSCDACLHQHLKRRYQVGYAEAFGAPLEGFVDFCEAHAAYSPSMLGV